MNRVGDKIDRFIEAELKEHPEQVNQFFERVQSNYDDCVRAATRYLLLMLATWFLTYAIHMGWITEIGWLGFKFKRKMIVAAPFLIGLLSYVTLSAIAGTIVLWEATIRRLRYVLPTAWANHLDDFLAPQTFSNVERLIEPMIKHSRVLVYFSRFWFLFVVVMIFGGDLAGIAHTTYLLFLPEVAIVREPPPITSIWSIISPPPKVEPDVTHWAVIVTCGSRRVGMD